MLYTLLSIQQERQNFKDYSNSQNLFLIKNGQISCICFLIPGQIYGYIVRTSEKLAHVVTTKDLTKMCAILS